MGYFALWAGKPVWGFGILKDRGSLVKRLCGAECCLCSELGLSLCWPGRWLWGSGAAERKALFGFSAFCSPSLWARNEHGSLTWRRISVKGAVLLNSQYVWDGFKLQWTSFLQWPSSSFGSRTGNCAWCERKNFHPTLFIVLWINTWKEELHFGSWLHP